MFNGYNETPLISYNEFNQERSEKKQENVPKWSYGHDAGGQLVQPHSNNRHSEFWSGKSNFLGIPNVLKCSCASCYPSSENQSYQGDSTRHRPWLPPTFSVPLNGSNESCKLPPYQWDNGLSSQGSCYPEGNLPYVQDGGGKYSYYRHYQTSRLPEPNQPGVITSVKNGEYAKKPKNEMPSPIQHGSRQPVVCNPAYNLPKRVDGRSYCDSTEKYSNVAYSLEQQVPRIPVVEPFLKAVPSNISQNRVPSTGYRSIKENMPQQYISSGYARKVSEPPVNGDKREAFSTTQFQSGLHRDYSYLNRDQTEVESQKLFFDNARHPDYYAKNNFQDVMKRNNQALDGRKDCAINQISQMSMSEQHYSMPRSKYPDVVNSKPSYEVFYPKDFEKSRQENPEEPVRFQRNEDAKSENANIRLPRPTVLFNDPHFADRTQNSFPYQSTQASYGSCLRSEYQVYNAQPRYKHPSSFQRNDINQYRTTAQQFQSCEQLAPPHTSGFVFDIHCQQNVDKEQQLYGGENQSSIQSDTQPTEIKKPPYLEAIRSEEISKNGTSKISPLRLLRKKKFINVPQESTPVGTFDAAPGLDVRKFWSTWAEEEEENVAPTQMVVLDCQNIDPEEAKLLHLYETDPVRAVHFDSGVVIKNTGCVKETVHFEEIKASEQSTDPKVEKEANCRNEIRVPQEELEKAEEYNTGSQPETEKKSEITEYHKMSPSKPSKKEKPEQENRGKKKSEIMDKWTEKKFDFLKRAEESKAAEILRHEEEKKKILETRLSLQQSLKKVEKAQTGIKEKPPERTSPFDENSQSDSPENGSGCLSDLPTSEYRRNKFLDYSERKVIVNRQDEVQKSTAWENETSEMKEIKKVEDLKPECLDKQTNENLVQFKSKLKEEPAFEMDNILKKMSEINFQNGEIKGDKCLDTTVKKPPKKLRKKKSDHQTEKEDKLLVETVTKPTIKFSIQKSHDLKISFKVLNNSNEYSDEDLGDRDAEANGSASEDLKNSTELITLKYKSIQRDGDQKQNLDSKKRRRAFRRKKQNFGMKTPVLKFKKKKYAAEEERDPLADDGEYSNDPRKQYSSSDDFQVKETVDSAKIKLTFKRHKGNFETEYKINSNTVEKLAEHHCEEGDKLLEEKLRTMKSEIVAEPGVESFQDYKETTPDFDSGPENTKVVSESAVEDSRNSSTSQDSYLGKENFELESPPPTFSEFPSDAEPGGATPENGPPTPSGERETHYAIENPKSNEETNKRHREHGEFTVNHLINCDDDIQSEGNWDELAMSDCNATPDISPRGSPELQPHEDELEKTNFEKEEIQEFSLDFIKSTNSREIKLDHKSRKTEEIENVASGFEAVAEERGGLENSGKVQETSRTEEAENDEKTLECDVPKISRNWEICPEGSDYEPNESSGYQGTATPLVNFEDESGQENNVTAEENEEVGNEVLPFRTITQLYPLDEDEPRENSPEAHESETSNLKLSSGSSTETHLKEDSKGQFPSEESFMPPETSLEELLIAVEREKLEPKTNCSKLLEEESHLDFDLQLENSSKSYTECDITETRQVENLGSDTQKSPKIIKLAEAEFSLPEKTNLESPELSGEKERLSRPEEDIKGIEVEAPDTSSSNLGHSSVSADLDQINSKAQVCAEDLPKHESVALTGPQFSPTGCDLKAEEEFLENDSGCVECSFDSTTEGREVLSRVKDSTVIEDKGLASPLDMELEDGEIVDSSNEAAECVPSNSENSTPRCRKEIDFIAKKLERRHSTDYKKTINKTPEFQTWSRRKFSKAKSCPPGVRHSEGKLVSCISFSVKDIPLPVGPPPLTSFLNFKKCTSSCETYTEAKKEQKISIFTERPFADQKQTSLSDSQPFRKAPFDLNDLQNYRNPSPPAFEKEPSLPGMLQRGSKVKFSFSKRSKFSKIGLNKAEDSKPKIAFNTPNEMAKVWEEPEKREIEGPDFEKSKKIRTNEESHSSPHAKYENEDVPNTKAANGVKEVKVSEAEEVKAGNESEHHFELPCESFDDNIEVANDFVRDDIYECEGIPISDDLPSGHDLELEKVNDDKFRNIMQNCLDNAKKFLNIGNLKLFSCSVEDLLDSECHASETTEENEAEKSTNHISRDVLLTSCDDANDDLGLPENDQPAELSMDFIPSFSSDVCPEILPLDNWPYLEEEVPSSPIMSKEESDLIPSLENTSPEDNPNRKFVATENDLRSFRRRSVTSDEEAFKLCSKISIRRRNTIDCFARPLEKDLSDIKSEITRLKRGTDDSEKKSLKYRPSLKKSLNKHDPNGFKIGPTKKLSEDLKNGVKIKSSKRVNYKSPSWQPKVMLFRISKSELRKVLRSSKAYKKFRSKISGESPKIYNELRNEVISPLKEGSSNFECEKFYVNPEIEKIAKTLDARSVDDEMLIRMPRFDSSFIKGSLSSTDPSKKKKKSRFRNLHTKRESESEAANPHWVTDTRNNPVKEVTTSDRPETLLTEMFKYCERITQSKHPKEDEDKAKKKTSESRPEKPSRSSSSREKTTEKDGETQGGRLKDELKENKHRERRKDHPDRRRERSVHRRERHKHGKETPKAESRENCNRKHSHGHGSGRERSRHSSEVKPTKKEIGKCLSEKVEEEMKPRIVKETTPETPWTCEVCGFNDATERVVHIKGHPFHCQSCHLAFKTEAHFIDHLTKKHKDIRNQHHCLLCELSFDTERQYQKHLDTREHKHLEAVEKNTINTLFTLLTGAPCPVLGVVDTKPEWLPNQAGTVHFYHQATPLSLALQYLKMHHDLSSFSTAPSAHPS